MSLTSLSLLNAHFDNKKKNEKCYGFITANGPVIEVTSVDVETGKTKFSIPFLSKELKEFMNDFKFTNAVYKAIIVDAALLHAPTTMYSNVMEFCKELKQKLNEQKIPNYFITRSDYEYSSVLAAANVKANFGDTVHMLMSFTEWIRYAEFKYTPRGYVLIKQNSAKIDPKKKQDFAEKFFGSTKPKKVIALQDPSGQNIKKLFKNIKMVILYNQLIAYRENFVVEICKWILDKSYTKFYVLPCYDRTFIAFDSRGNADPNEYEKGVEIMYANHFCQLPIQKTAVFPRSNVELVLLFIADFSTGLNIKYHYKPELKRDCHRYELKMQIDEECFETFTIEQIILDPIKNLSIKLDGKMETKIPVIGFFDNSSVVCVHKNNNYQFLDACNGMYGVDHFISFDKEKPKVGQAAMKMLSTTKASFVVYDLLKIMSMSLENVKVNSAWQFTITKDSDNPILIEFKDHKGGKLAASPAFLMALLIKQYLKAVKKEIGEKPKEIGLWIFDDEFTEDEKKRIKEGLEESCRLLKIKCSFVD